MFLFLFSRSVMNAKCRICRRKTDPEKMLLCDGCDRGHHMYCLKPKLKSVPQGDWYCNDCKPKERLRSPKKKTKRRNFSMVEDDDDSNEAEEQEEADDDDEDNEAASDDEEDGEEEEEEQGDDDEDNEEENEDSEVRELRFSKYRICH